jgi:hypothetical protein
MRTALIYLLLLVSGASSSFKPASSVFANVKMEHVKNTRSLSLCNLMKDVDQYNGRLVRVRVVVVGTGGHYPFFITGQGCDTESVIAMGIRYQHWDRTKAIFEKNLFDVLAFNLEAESPKAALIIVGRVSNRSRRSPRLMLSVSNIEVEVPD